MISMLPFLNGINVIWYSKYSKEIFNYKVKIWNANNLKYMSV